MPAAVVSTPVVPTAAAIVTAALAMAAMRPSRAGACEGQGGNGSRREKLRPKLHQISPI
jgi:Spy/CpxP family protein refolding chaperone